MKVNIPTCSVESQEKNPSQALKKSLKKLKKRQNALELRKRKALPIGPKLKRKWLSYMILQPFSRRL
jgi:hypothetical protein